MIIAVIRALSAVVWSVLMISSSLILFAITWNHHLPVKMARNQWAPGILWICGLRLKVNGAKHLDIKRSYVFVCNHQSYLDIPVLFRVIPINLYFVAKKELKHIPFLGWYMMATGMIFIDRSNREKSRKSLEKSAHLIQRGKSVIMFPEGTRSRDGLLADFKKGPFVLAKKAEVPVVPVGIQETGEPFSLSRLGKTHLEINIGEPVNIGDDLQHHIRSVHDRVAELSGRDRIIND